MLKNIHVMCMLLLASGLSAQTLNGRIIDSETKTGIPFANIHITNVQIGVISDSLGYFAVNSSLPENIDVRISASLYETAFLSVKSGGMLVFELNPEHIDFDDIIVSGPTGGSSGDNSYGIEKLKLNDLYSLQSSSLGEAIANINGVQEASFGAGISKPVIRGMQGLRVITLINGMRVENQQWGGDHGMAVNQLGIGSAEVIKGPSSLLYGADAFGGVLYLVDEPYNKQNAYELTLNSKFESVNMGTTNSMGLKVAKGVFRFNLDGLYADYADYQVPNGKFAMNTRFGEYGIKSSIGVSKKNWVSHLRYTYSENRTGLPGHAHHDGETEEEHEENYSDVQNRVLLRPFIQGTNHLISLENKFFIQKNELSFLMGYTYNRLQEFEEDIELSALHMRLTNAIYNVKYKHIFNQNWNLVTGIQGMYQVNTNDATAEEQLIPNYEQSDNGIYVIGFYKKNVWNFQIGARYDARLLTAKGAGYDNYFGSPNFSAGLGRTDSKRTIRLNISSGFRAPHLSELLSDGEHDGAIRYELGNVNLTSEKSYQADFSYMIHREHFEWVINPFYSFIENYIYLANQDTVINDLPVYEYTQVPQASLYGIDFVVHHHPHFAHWLHLESNYSYIRGEDFKGRSFALIPQSKISSVIRINTGMKTKFEINEITLQHQYYFAQNKVDQFETGSKAYQLVHVGMDLIWNLKTPLRIGLGVKNVLNEKYINHLSRLKNIGLESPGRNFYLSIKYQIPGNFK